MKFLSFKKLFFSTFFVAVFFFPHESFALSNVRLIQQATSTITSGSTQTITLVNSPTIGHTLIYAVGVSSTAISVSSVSQTGVTWKLAVASDTQRDVEIWYGNVVSPPSTSVSVTFSNVVSSTATGNVSEWNSILVQNALDKTGSTNGDFTTATTSLIATTRKDEIIFAIESAGLSNGSSITTPTNNFTLLNATTTRNVEIAYFITTSTNSFYTSFGLSFPEFQTAIASFDVENRIFFASQKVVVKQGLNVVASIGFGTSTTDAGGLQLTSRTFNFTIAPTSTNRILYVLDIGDVTSQHALIVPTVTYAGVPMTFAGEVDPVDNTDRYLMLFSLINPATGTNAVVVTSTTATDMFPAARYYTGVQQTGQPEASSTNTCAACTSLTTTLTVSSTRSWTFLAIRTRNTSSPGPGTSILYDSGRWLPTGSYSMNITQNLSGSMSTIMVAMAPASVSRVTSGRVVIKGKK